MPSFTDNRGRDWSVCLTVDGLCRVRECLGVELFDTLGSDDVRVQVNVLYAICLPQVLAMKRRRRRAPDVDFGRSLVGVLPAAIEALAEAVDLFLPPPSPTTEAATPPADKPLSVLCWQAVYRCAGIVGVHPGPFTLRQLAEMAEAKSRHDWSQMASLMAHLMNLKAGKIVSSPKDYGPFAAERSTHKVKAGEAALMMFGSKAS